MARGGVRGPRTSTSRCAGGRQLDVCLHVLGTIHRPPDPATASTMPSRRDNPVRPRRGERLEGPAHALARGRRGTRTGALERFLEAGGAALLAHPGLDDRRDCGGPSTAACVRRSASTLLPMISPRHRPGPGTALRRRPLHLLLPVPRPRAPRPPPDGTEEGEELVHPQPRHPAAVRQVVLDLETEVRPAARAALAELAGRSRPAGRDPSTERRIEECPLVAFSPANARAPNRVSARRHDRRHADGEMLCGRTARPTPDPVPASTVGRSWSRPIRQAAGWRVSGKLDREYWRLKPRERIRGAPRTPSLKPGHGRLLPDAEAGSPVPTPGKDKEALRELASLAGGRTPGRAERLTGTVMRDHVGKAGSAFGHPWPRPTSAVLARQLHQNRSKRSFLALHTGQTSGGPSRAQR